MGDNNMNNNSKNIQNRNDINQMNDNINYNMINSQNSILRKY